MPLMTVELSFKGHKSILDDLKNISKRLKVGGNLIFAFSSFAFPARDYEQKDRMSERESAIKNIFLFGSVF